ncbi:leucine-rich repeat domain-containing protein [Curvibacter sp. RS43]|uniref:leucine-rich repeat domain-containing protein n=1 Tax=Curvibacter microcysteis TaxID=3026419 RepID=UPI002362B433|nr:leucine-rich repeat domain-containing protein [Curvibacter sp. RS43]MDD0812581.1 leucine-rich repeat domain-containing protein [Curvibacter sp. RS43]
MTVLVHAMRRNRPAIPAWSGCARCLLGLIHAAVSWLAAAALPAWAALPSEQTQALVKLYQTTQGPGWRKQEGWLQGDPCERPWQGVLCNPEGSQVLGLLLPGNHLKGHLPEELTHLRALQHLDLRNNLTLQGSLPRLADWPRLQTLNVSFNQFSGPLPALKNLSQLESLVVSNNLLTGPLPDLVNLASLRNLRVNHNQFSGTLPAWSTPKLRVADLSFNRFSGPLPSLSNLPALDTLVADWNRFSGPLLPLPPNSALRTLTVSGNLLSGPLPPFAQQAQLAVLQLDHNQFKGPLPEFQDLPALTRLNLSYNQLQGVVPALNQLPSLQSLQLEGNQLSGPLPPAPANLTYFRLCPNNTDKAPTSQPDPKAVAAANSSTWPSRIQCPSTTLTSQRQHREPGPPQRPVIATDTEPPESPQSLPPAWAPRRQGACLDDVHLMPAIPSAAAGCLHAPAPTAQAAAALLDDSMLPPLSEWLMALSGLLALATTLLIWNLRIPETLREAPQRRAGEPAPAQPAHD